MALDNANDKPRFATLECTENSEDPKVTSRTLNTEDNVMTYVVRAGEESGIVTIDEDGTAVEGPFKFPSDEDDEDEE